MSRRKRKDRYVPVSGDGGKVTGMNWAIRRDAPIDPDILASDPWCAYGVKGLRCGRGKGEAVKAAPKPTRNVKRALDLKI